MLTTVSKKAMRFWMTKTAAVLLALLFPWGSAMAGGTALCFRADGHVGFGPGAGLVCAGAQDAVELNHPAAAPCSECLDTESCADIPGKGLLHRPPPGAAPWRGHAGLSLPYALAMAHTSSCLTTAPTPPPAQVLDGQHQMRLHLYALRTVLLRL